MITIKNSQRNIALNKELLQHNAQKILALLDYTDFDLGILITNNKTIRNYNREYRHKNKPTDILSFPHHPTLQAGKRITIQEEDDKNLGDLIISAEYVAEEAKKYNVTFEQRLLILLIHGICHLLGYDHINDADFRRMRVKEAFILKKLNN